MERGKTCRSHLLSLSRKTRDLLLLLGFCIRKKKVLTWCLAPVQTILQYVVAPVVLTIRRRCVQHILSPLYWFSRRSSHSQTLSSPNPQCFPPSQPVICPGISPHSPASESNHRGSFQRNTNVQSHPISCSGLRPVSQNQHCHQSQGLLATRGRFELPRRFDRWRELPSSPSS